jgi:hypothetical protein
VPSLEDADGFLAGQEAAWRYSPPRAEHMPLSVEEGDIEGFAHPKRMDAFAGGQKQDLPVPADLIVQKAPHACPEAGGKLTS